MSTETTTRTSPTQVSASRGLTATLWVLRVVTAVGFLLAAYTKLSGMPQVMAMFEAIGTGPWLAYVIGVLEILGVIGLLVPRLCGTAAGALTALTIGAVIAHLLVGGDPSMAILLLVLSAVIAWFRRHDTARLIRSVRS